MTTHILGISAYYHDSAAALISDGNIIAAAQEERFTRKKHDAGFPKNAIEYCLQEAGIELAQVSYVVFYDKPLIKFERLLETYLSYAPLGFSIMSRMLLRLFFHARSKKPPCCAWTVSVNGRPVPSGSVTETV